MLGVEYLQFDDGLKERQKRLERATEHAELLDTVFRAGLVATGGYKERVLFPDRFEAEAGLLPPGDADTDFDYGEVEWRTPDEEELALLKAMLSDPTITVAAGAEGAPAQELPPPREIPLTDIEQDREWV